MSEPANPHGGAWWLAITVALAIGAALAFGLPGDLDARFYRRSLPGAHGLVRYLVGDYAGAARAYRRDLGWSAPSADGEGDPAQTALITGDLVAAAASAQEVLGRDPANVSARLTLAEVALQRASPQEALANLEPVLKGRTEVFDAFLLGSVAYARMGESGLAIDLLNRALRASNMLERPTSFLQVLEVTGELTRQPVVSRPACLLAHLHRYLRIFDSSHGRVAIRRATEAVARGDHPADAYLTIGVVYEKQGYPDDALAALLLALEHDPRHSEALRWAALQYRWRGDLTSEYQMIKRAYEATPSDPAIVSHFGDILMRRLGDLRQAKAVWTRAVQADPDNVFALQQLGAVEQYLGNSTRAVEILEDALRRDPARAVTRWHLGYSLVEAGRAEDAVRLFQEWVRQAPGDPTAHTNLGVVYGRARREREAIKELEQAFQLGERGLDYYEYLCELYFYEATDFQRAAQCFNQLLWWQPGRPRSLQLLPEVQKNLALSSVRGR